MYCNPDNNKDTSNSIDIFESKINNIDAMRRNLRAQESVEGVFISQEITKNEYGNIEALITLMTDDGNFIKIPIPHSEKSKQRQEVIKFLSEVPFCQYVKIEVSEEKPFTGGDKNPFKIYKAELFEKYNWKLLIESAKERFRQLQELTPEKI